MKDGNLGTLAALSVRGLLPLAPHDQHRLYRMAAIIRSIAIALLGTVIVVSLRDHSAWVMVAAGVWMYPGIVVTWITYRRCRGVLPPHLWLRDVVSFAVFAAIVPMYFVPALLGSIAIIAFLNYTVVRRMVISTSIVAVVAVAIAAAIVREETAVVAAAFFPLAVLALVLPSQLLAGTMQRSISFNSRIAEELRVAMFESAGVPGEPSTMIHLYAPASRRFEPTMTEEEWLDILHPDDLPVSEQIDHAVLEGRDYHVRYRQRTNGTDYRWIEEIGRVQRVGDQVHVSGMTRDVTEFVAREEQLRRLDELAQLVDVSISILHLPDPDDPRSLTVVWENETARRTDPAGGHEGQRVVDFNRHAFDTERHRGVGFKMAEVALGAPTWSIGDTHIRLRGEMRYFSTVVSPLPDRHCAVVMHDVTELVLARAELERLAFVDPLTELPNRARLREVIGQAPVGSMLFVLDLDRFNDVNEAFGHSCGDELMIEVAHVLSNAPDGAVVARMGGDEFGILTPPSVGQRDELVARIFQAFSRPMQLPNGLALQASISMGITTKLRADTPADELLRQADVALKKAKIHRNTNVVYDPQADTSAPHRMMLLGELRRALVSGELELHHQPAVDARTGRVSSAEALLVWRHPTLGAIPTTELDEVVRLSNLHADIVVHALREAVRHYGTWARAGAPTPVSINVDGATLHDAALVERMIAVVREADLPLHAIGVEIDERELRLDDGSSPEALRRLREAGLWLTIDRFGSGKTRVQALRTNLVNAIKVEAREIVEFAGSDDTLIRTIVRQIHGLGLTIASDGVDDEATFRQLIDLGVDQVQGTHVGGPMTCEALLDFVVTHRPLPVAGA
ncbi:MAG: EAL domain-containing protein [Acidimicrobiales bacterium]